MKVQQLQTKEWKEVSNQLVQKAIFWLRAAPKLNKT